MVQPWLKIELGFKPDTPDEVVEKEWKRRTEHVCKPCWELKYCPYGPLVERFPLYPDEKAKAEELGWYTKFVEGQGWMPCSKNDEGATADISKVFSEFGSLNEKACKVFGHICPVFFVNEPFTETTEMRKITRRISRTLFLRVVRRDNQTCRICGKILREDEIEIDHIIPFSKGGPTEESNLRVLCKSCNQKKRSSLDI